MLALCNFDWCYCLYVYVSFLTRLFKSSLHPLGEPAQVTVTVQGVGTESANGRRVMAVRTMICHSRLKVKQMDERLQVGQRGEVVEGSLGNGGEVVTVQRPEK